MKKKTTKAATKRGVVSATACSAKRMTVEFSDEVAKLLAEMSKREGRTQVDILKRALGVDSGHRCSNCGHIEHVPTEEENRVLRNLKWL